MSTAKLDEKGIVVACPQCGQRNRLQYERLGQATRCGKCKADIPGATEPVAVENESHFNALIRFSQLPVLVDFWAPWCGPCKMVAPEFDKVAATSAGEFVVVKVNTDEQQGLAQRYKINSIPTLIVFHGGEEVSRTAGARPAEAIKTFVREAVAQPKA